MNIQDKANKYNWCANSLSQLEKELELFVQDGFEIPKEPGGWWHQYVCPHHHTELGFDPLEKDAHEFICPYGCKLEGEPYRGAWLVYKHQSLARYALQAAAVYAGTHNPRYAELGKSILIRYAEQFPQYPVHPDAQPWMLKGRAFHQALTEAIWATTLIRAYLLLQDEGVTFDEGSKPLNTFFEMLEESISQYRDILVYERKNPESNYTAWLNAALACVYTVQRNQDKLDSLINGEGGLVHHLSIGVMPDHFEFEGSTYYHIFVLRAYLIVAEMAERFKINLFDIKGEKGQSFEGMFDVLVTFSNEQGLIAALHDGPYKRVPFARELAEIFEIGLTHYDNQAYIPILAEANRQMYGSAERQGLEALVFGSGDLDLTVRMPERSSHLFPESGFAVGRHSDNSLSFFVDFGPHGGSHGHFDKLHLTINHQAGAVTPDLGMVPYGSSLRTEWYPETASHNTVSIGGQSQQPHTGKCVKYEANDKFTMISIKSDEGYDNCVMVRHLLLTADWLLDWFTVECEKETEIDWWMHHLASEPANNNEQWKSFEGALGESNSYAKIKAKRVWDSSSVFHSLLPVGTESGSDRVSFTALVTPNSQFIEFQSPGTADDPSVHPYGLLHRQFGKTGEFINVYRNGQTPLQIEKADSSTIRIVGENKQWVCRLAGNEGIQLESN